MECVDIDNLQDLLPEEGLLPPVLMDTDNLDDVLFDQKEFQDGVNSISRVCGVITALLNTGVSEGFVLDYLVQESTIKHNLKMAEMNNKTQIEISRNQKLMIEKNEL